MIYWKKFFFFFTPKSQGNATSVHTVWLKVMQTNGLKEWICRDIWMPVIDFEGRSSIILNNEKIAATKMQYKLFEVTPKATVIQARIYKVVKKYKLLIPAGESARKTFYRQTQLIEKQMKKTCKAQIALYNRENTPVPEKDTYSDIDPSYRGIVARWESMNIP